MFAVDAEEVQERVKRMFPSHEVWCAHVHYYRMDNGKFGAERRPGKETHSYRCDAPATRVFSDALGDRHVCQAHHDEWSAEIT